MKAGPSKYLYVGCAFSHDVLCLLVVDVFVCFLIHAFIDLVVVFFF